MLHIKQALQNEFGFETLEARADVAFVIGVIDSTDLDSFDENIWLGVLTFNGKLWCVRAEQPEHCSDDLVAICKPFDFANFCRSA